MMKHTTTPLLLTLLIALLAACNSTPDIPDDAPTEQPAYRSTTTTSEDTTTAETTDTDTETSAPDSLSASGDVAIVNSEPITATQFDTEVQKLVNNGQLPPHILSQIQGEQREQLKKQLVQSMIVQRLLEQEIKKNPIEITQPQLDARIQQMEMELSMASQGRITTIEDMQKQMGISKEELMKSIKQSLVLEALVRKEYQYEDATEADARSYYDENTSEFYQPEQVHARHILIKVTETDNDDAWMKAKKEITKVHKKTTADGADFAALAKEYSEDGSAPQGGDLGFFPRNAMVPEFEKVAFELENGEVSEPFRSQFGWHIVKRVDYKQEGPIPFEDIKERLTTQLTGLKFQQSLEQYVAKLQESASIELKLENIK